MARYTKKDNDGRYYIESINGKLESNIFGHTYGEAIDRFAELENADVAPMDEVRAATINEFADRIKKYYANLSGFSSTMLIGYYVDQIAKEMLGGDGNASDQTL